MSDFPEFCKEGDEIIILDTGEHFVKHDGSWQQPTINIVKESSYSEDPATLLEKEVAVPKKKTTKKVKKNDN